MVQNKQAVTISIKFPWKCDSLYKQWRIKHIMCWLQDVTTSVALIGTACFFKTPNSLPRTVTLPQCLPYHSSFISLSHSMTSLVTEECTVQTGHRNKSFGIIANQVLKANTKSLKWQNANLHLKHWSSKCFLLCSKTAPKHCFHWFF